MYKLFLKHLQADGVFQLYGFSPNSQSLWVDGQIVGSQSFNQGALAVDKVGKDFSGEIAEVLVFDEQINSVSRQKD